MATETQAIRENYDLGVLAGEAREQARIIKLLEDKLVWIDYEGIGIKGGWTITPNQLIALIKGESQKDNETVVLLTEGEK